MVEIYQAVTPLTIPLCTVPSANTRSAVYASAMTSVLLIRRGDVPGSC